MIESVFEWNRHSILFEGLIVESVFELNYIESYLRV